VRVYARVLVPTNLYVHTRTYNIDYRLCGLLGPHRIFSLSRMAATGTSCHACGKSGCKLLRCGRCRKVWFCNRGCQVVAARGHSGANCGVVVRPPTPEAEAAEEAPRAPAAAGPRTTGLTRATSSCHTCGKSGGKLLRCGQCKNVWFCNRECQVVARNELGHKGANCHPADGAQIYHASAPPSQTSTHMDAAKRTAKLAQRVRVNPATVADLIGGAEGAFRAEVDQIRKLVHSYHDLLGEAHTMQMENTRIGNLVVVEKLKEAAMVADLIGGAQGAYLRADADQLRSTILSRLGDGRGLTRAGRLLIASDGACVGQHDVARQRAVQMRRRGVGRAGRDG